MKNILLVEDDLAFNELLRKLLVSEGYSVETAMSGVQAMEMLKGNKPDLVLTDYRLPGLDGLELMEKIQHIDSNIPVILMTSYADIRTAVRSIKIGAFDFVSKPIVPDEFLKIIKLALNGETKTRASNKDGRKPQVEGGYVRGQNEAMQQVWQHLELVSPTQMNVVIYGESGAGKEQIARSLHQMSRRANKLFTALDCGTLSTELAASELFGHAKGAFTGAHASKVGLFEQTDGGTLFLDEIGNLPYEIQVTLLRVIQEGRIRRVGETRDIEVNVRIVAATNEPLTKLVDQGKFRLDLYHRLNEFELHIPPLRERLIDIGAYCEQFIDEACSEFGKEPMTLSREVYELFLEYLWPGNLRELKNILRRAVVLSSTSTITLNELPNNFRRGTAFIADHDSEAPEKLPHASAEEPLSLKSNNRASEKQLILKALELSRFNKTKAAQLLGIDRTTLYKKMKHHRIAH